jgi:hypothetical protein
VARNAAGVIGADVQMEFGVADFGGEKCRTLRQAQGKLYGTGFLDETGNANLHGRRNSVEQ